MPRKKVSVSKSRLVACNMCGRAIQKKGTSIAKTFDGFAYNFDSDDCLLIFRKLRAIYGKDFFKPARSP